MEWVTDSLLLFTVLYFRPPVSRALPLPEKLQTNNVGKKKRPIEVRKTLISSSSPFRIFFLPEIDTFVDTLNDCFILNASKMEVFNSE